MSTLIGLTAFLGSEVVMIPVHEPEVMRTVKEKQRTTVIDHKMWRSVKLISRYGKADELKTMMAILDRIQGDACDWMIELFCDSKAGCAYQVQLRSGCANDGKSVADALDLAMRRVQGGHNGIALSCGFTPMGYVDPYWAE